MQSAFSLELLVPRLEICDLGLPVLLHFLYSLSVLALHVSHGSGMLAFTLSFLVSLSFLKLLDDLRELLLGIIEILLGGLLLLLQEGKLAFPQCLVLVISAADISKLALELVVLSSPLLNLLLNSKLVSLQR